MNLKNLNKRVNVLNASPSNPMDLSFDPILLAFGWFDYSVY